MYSSIYILSKVNLIMFCSFMIFIRPPWRLLVAHAPRRTTEKLFFLDTLGFASASTP